MAGVRKKPRPNGRYIGWYMDMSGRLKCFAGTRKKAETLQMAERLEDEHRQIKLGYRPVPKAAEKFKCRIITEVIEEYLAWGKSQGGRGGMAWGVGHARMREAHLKWWVKRLGLKRVADLDDILAKTEEALRELQNKGRAGKTLQNYRECISSFCNWAVSRGYLYETPMKNSIGFDTTAKSKRRAMTEEEIWKLLDACNPKHRLTYEVAFLSGLRANELRSLKVAHLDFKRGGIWLDAEWTKNRKPGFQNLPSHLMEKLKDRERNMDRESALLYIPSHPGRELDKDLGRAGIPKWTPEGKIDFHAIRVTYTTLVVESGANVKEAQDLLRHSTPDLTMNTYARSRQERLSELAEAVGERVNKGEKYALFRTILAAGLEDVDVNTLSNKKLAAVSDEWRRRDSNPRPDAFQ